VVDRNNKSPALPSHVSAETIAELYERRAHEYDHDRSRSVQEQGWLDAFLRYVRPAGTILDVGCGMGEPLGRYLLDHGCHVVGVDSSPSLIELCRLRFPEAEWFVADMRQMALGRRFDGVLAWDSFFHLNIDDQRGMFARFAAHARSFAPLMFTSGASEGEAIGSYHGDLLYHASLGPEEYCQLLVANGFVVRAHQAEDPECGGHTVWLATFGPDSAVRLT
jgi:SAM-dependent methyltransferase